MTVNFRLATEAETDLAAEIHRRAFGQDEEAGPGQRRRGQQEAGKGKHGES